MIKRGFTLIEVLIVLTIIGILSAGISAFSVSSLTSADFTSTVNEIKSFILTAENRAIENYENTDSGVHFEADSFTIFSADVYDPLDETALTRELEQTVSLESITFNGNPDLIFNNYTGIPVNAGSLSISSNKGDSATISVSTLGVVTVTFN